MYAGSVAMMITNPLYAIFLALCPWHPRARSIAAAKACLREASFSGHTWTTHLLLLCCTVLCIMLCIVLCTLLCTVLCTVLCAVLSAVYCVLCCMVIAERAYLEEAKLLHACMLCCAIQNVHAASRPSRTRLTVHACHWFGSHKM